MNEPRRAAVYCRVSTYMQERDGVSLDAQLDMAREHCRRKGWELTEHYVDVMSGTSDKRPDLIRLEEDVAAGKLDAVICYKVDRISRNVAHFHEVLAKLEKKGVDLVGLTQELDTSTAMGRLILNILISVAQNEAEVISERVTMAMRYKASQGHVLLTSPPYGYRYVKGYLDADGRKVPPRIEVIEDQAEVVRLAFELYLEHRNVRAVCRALNGMGYPSPIGSRWQATAVARLLQNPTYQGDLVYGRGATKRQGRNKRMVKQPASRWVVHAGGVPAIVSREVAAAARAILEKNAQQAPRRANSNNHRTWSSLLCCATCGSQLWYHKDATGFVSYGCYAGEHIGGSTCLNRGRFSELALEQLVLPAIAKAFDHTSLIERSGAKPAPRRARKRVDRAKLLSEIEEAKKRELNLYRKGLIGESELDANLASLDAKATSLPAEEEASSMPALPVLPGSFMETWHGLPSDGDRGRFLQFFVGRIEVTRDAALIHFHAFDHPDWPTEPVKVDKKRVRRWHKRPS